LRHLCHADLLPLKELQGWSGCQSSAGKVVHPWHRPGI
jgi:hypothetical protein